MLTTIQGAHRSLHIKNDLKKPNKTYSYKKFDINHANFLTTSNIAALYQIVHSITSNALTKRGGCFKGSSVRFVGGQCSLALRH